MFEDNTQAQMAALKRQQDAETNAAAARAMSSSASAGNPMQSFASGFGKFFDAKEFRQPQSAGNAAAGIRASSGTGTQLAAPSDDGGGGLGLKLGGAAKAAFAQGLTNGIVASMNENGDAGGQAAAAASTGLGGSDAQPTFGDISQSIPSMLGSFGRAIKKLF